MIGGAAASDADVARMLAGWKSDRATSFRRIVAGVEDQLRDGLDGRPGLGAHPRALGGGDLRRAGRRGGLDAGGLRGLAGWTPHGRPATAALIDRFARWCQTGDSESRERRRWRQRCAIGPPCAGAESGSRTRTRLPSSVFETDASAIPPPRRCVGSGRMIIIPRCAPPTGVPVKSEISWGGPPWPP